MYWLLFYCDNYYDWVDTQRPEPAACEVFLTCVCLNNRPARCVCVRVLSERECNVISGDNIVVHYYALPLGQDDFFFFNMVHSV